MFKGLSICAALICAEFDWLSGQDTFEDDMDSRAAVLIELATIPPMKAAVYLTIAVDTWNKAHAMEAN